MNKTRKNKPKNKRNKRNTRVFSKKDFCSGDGMLTSVWGPSMWHNLHTMSFNYPNAPTSDDKRHYKNMILNLIHVLPCKFCRINLKNNLKAMPLKSCHLKNRDMFSRYVYDLHEHINKMLHKKSGLSYCDIRERYEHFRSRCTLENPKVFNHNKTKKKHEKGCTEPLYGKKAKCVIKIIPHNERGKTFQIDKKCIKYKIK